MKHIFTLLTKLLPLVLVCGATPAQSNYPQKSISIVVPYVTGGVSDALARALAIKLSANLGQQVLVENKPGGNTLIGATHVAKSSPDGYTLLLTAESTLTMNPMLYAKLPYDVDKNFAPIIALASIPQSFVISPSIPAKNLSEFVQLAKKQPKHYSFANLGIGSSAHLNFELFQRVTELQLVDIAYKGASAAITDLIGGHVSAMIVSTGLVSAQARANNLRVLAVAGSKRSTQLPDVPTFKEVLAHPKRFWKNSMLRATKFSRTQASKQNNLIDSHSTPLVALQSSWPPISKANPKDGLKSSKT
jgi:tripartite-type tricarboxylate transporter receptor subunit TctC